MLPEPGSPVFQSVRAALARCSAMGVAALVLTPQGRIVDASPLGSIAGGRLDVQSLGDAVSRLVPPALASRTVALTDTGVGAWTGIIPLTDDAGGCMVVAPVFFLQGAFNQSTAELALVSLRAAFDDAIALQQRAGDLDNFTMQLAHAYDTIDVLYALGRSMGRPQTPREFLAPLCARTRSVLNFSWVAACFSADRSVPDTLRNVTAVDGDLLADLDSCRRTLLGWSQSPLDTLTIHDTVPAFGGKLGGQVISVPLVLRGAHVGVLAAGGKSGPDPMVSSYDTQLFEACAGFLSTFIENVALYSDQKQMFLGTLQALTAAIDAKDRYTCGHSERVSIISWQLAEAAGLGAPQAERIRIAGLVHDVGKIGVPEAVLIKPGKLTDEEFAAIKRHPEIGHRILLPVPQLADVLPGVMHHHERWDGRGYPHKLAGEAIPFQARIIAVADTFDAMSSDRSYRKRLSREQVLAEIARVGGTQLDPRLATLMVEMDLGLYDEMTIRHAQELGSTDVSQAA